MTTDIKYKIIYEYTCGSCSVWSEITNSYQEALEAIDSVITTLACDEGFKIEINCQPLMEKPYNDD